MELNEKLGAVSEEIEAVEEVQGEEIEKKNNKYITFFIVVGVVVLVGLGGFLGLKLTFGSEKTEIRSSLENDLVDVEKFDDRVWSVGVEAGGLIEDYCEYRLKLENLLTKEFRELDKDGIAARLDELKEGFAGINRSAKGYARFEKDEGSRSGGVSASDGFGKVLKIIESDSSVFLSKIRSARQVMTREFSDEADRQLEFMKVAESGQEKILSAVYQTDEVFKGDEGDLLTKSGLLVRGKILLEVGGGVMNLFVADEENETVAVSSEDYLGAVKTIQGEEEMVLRNDGKLVRVGKGVKEELAIGKGILLRTLEGEECKEQCKEGEIKVERVRIGMFGRSVFDIDELFREKGMRGFVREIEENAGVAGS